MRNVILGGIGVLWGGGVVLYSLFGSTRGSGAYGAGQATGTVFGVIFFVVGLFYLINGIRSLSEDETE